jgi:outer membrane protein assembly factor BamB
MKLLLILQASFIIAGCSGITVDKQINTGPDDWIMGGGSAEQKNVSAFTLAPPLNLYWEFNLEGGVGSSGIAVADAVLFVNALQGEMFSFDISTGGKIGNLKFLGKDASTTPLILNNNVIVTYAGDKKYSLASYDLVNGKINWRRNYGDLQTSPILKDGYIYFGGLNGNFYKIDVHSGKLIWKFGSKGQIHSTCAVGNGIAVFGNDKGAIYGVDINSGSEKWKLQTANPVHSAPLVNDSVAYIGCSDSNYYAINLADGSVKWKRNLHSKIVGGSALYKPQNVLVGCVDGSLYSLDINDGSVKWRSATKGAIVSAPVISGNYVYCSSFDGFIYCFDASNGNVLWSTMLENKVKTAPVIWRDYLFTAADEIVYCFTTKNVEKKN